MCVTSKLKYIFMHMDVKILQKEREVMSKDLSAFKSLYCYWQ